MHANQPWLGSPASRLLHFTLAVIDPKQGEREYYARIGEAGREHVRLKPFSDEQCVEHLNNVTVLMSLLRPPPGRIAEFGCGPGWLGLFFARRGYDVVGVDISPEAIELARQLAAERGITNATYHVADYETVKIDPPVDYVIFHDALHHAESEFAALRAAHAALVPGGMVFCLEPGEGHGSSAHAHAVIREFGVHEKDMPPRTIVRHARAAGFRGHRILPWPWFYLRSVYRPEYVTARTLAARCENGVMRVYRLLRTFVRARRQGLVVLWKE